MHRFQLIAAFLFSLLLISCGGEKTTDPLTVKESAILEMENYIESDGAERLEWLITESLPDAITAVRLSPRVSDSVVSERASERASLTYTLEFIQPGEYRLSLHARSDISTSDEQSLEVIFGADEGNVSRIISGLTHEWNWVTADEHAQPLTISITTAGVHHLEVSSDTEGVELDQLTITRIQSSVDAEQQSDTDTLSLDDSDSAKSNAEQEDKQQQEVKDSVELGNQAPTVLLMTTSQSTTTSQPLTLMVTAEDDGKPNKQLYYYWSMTSGPGNARFSALQEKSTEVTFDNPGTYSVQITVSDGERYTNAWQLITVTKAPANNSGNDNQESANTETPSESETNGIKAFGRWKEIATRGHVTERHETGGVVVNGKLYVIGGRDERPVEVYDPNKNTWKKIAQAPMEMHHFQPVAIGQKIYVVGAFTCCYPREEVIDNIYIFDTVSHKWSQGPKLPANRKRGGGGAAVYNGKIYLVGGNTEGHQAGAVNWFDEFDPKTGQWKKLKNAPDARDHMTVAVVNGKLVVAGGRKTDFPVPFDNTVGRTNVYDFKSGKWTKADNIPTQRAGTMTVAFGSEVIVIGGESESTSDAHRDVEAFSLETKKWRKLAKLQTGRHGGVAGVLDSEIHVVAGNIKRAGGNETSSHEVLR